MSSRLVSIDEIIKFIRKVTSFFCGFNKRHKHMSFEFDAKYCFSLLFIAKSNSFHEISAWLKAALLASHEWQSQYRIVFA